MRPTGTVLSALAILFAAQTARADLGPPPACGAGTHHEYLYGHHCVPDGFHLEPGEAGVQTVKDPPSLAPSTTPTPTPTATPKPTKTETPPPPPPPKSSCTYGAADDLVQGAWWSIAPLVGLFLRRRLKARRSAIG